MSPIKLHAAAAGLLAALALLAAARPAAAAASAPRTLSCPPSVIQAVTSCTASGTVVAGECSSRNGSMVGGQRLDGSCECARRGAARCPPPPQSTLACCLTHTPTHAAAGANVTYAFSIEPEGPGHFDLSFVLRCHSGDADL